MPIFTVHQILDTPGFASSFASARETRRGENPPTTNVVEEHQVFSSDGTILPTAPKISSENADDYSSAVSPDGKQIIFSSYRLKNAELFLLDIVSGQITQLTQTPKYCV